MCSIGVVGVAVAASTSGDCDRLGREYAADNSGQRMRARCPARRFLSGPRARFSPQPIQVDGAKARAGTLSLASEAGAPKAAACCSAPVAPVARATSAAAESRPSSADFRAAAVELLGDAAGIVDAGRGGAVAKALVRSAEVPHGRLTVCPPFLALHSYHPHPRIRQASAQARGRAASVLRPRPGCPIDVAVARANFGCEQYASVGRRMDGEAHRLHISSCSLIAPR
eukprot:CAMPEP_0176200288 /NCGR_PEP_ID=MMETSP0121_2-20121125/8982_1 /TAXON_ID=160619 /ORGANISM="Kryptoperidinium foliaceum, Strain CCMP 1326" /LENGTH=226 /DNA_ID=CAMNT_0017539147 /DNA_START=580 /DNA_END=1261 /DNA_ORIENTATION=-